MTISLITIAMAAIAILLFLAANGSDSRGPLRALRERIFDAPAPALAPLPDRIETRARIAREYPWITDADGEAVVFLLGEVKSAFDFARDGIKNLDTKAGTLIGVVTTGLGAIALLGDASKLPAKTAFLYLGVVLLLVALFAAVLSLPTRGLPVPRLSNYALLSILAAKDNRARIQYELIETWLQDTRRAEGIAVGKARLLLVAAFAIVLGVLCLTANWAIGINTTVPEKPTTVQLLGPVRPPSHPLRRTLK